MCDGLYQNLEEVQRLRSQQLYEALQDEEEEKRIEAADILRSLLEKIVLTPVGGKVEGDLAGILTIAAQTQNPAAGKAAGSQVNMVAGA